jgi:hypothetical protein
VAWKGIIGTCCAIDLVAKAAVPEKRSISVTKCDKTGNFEPPYFVHSKIQTLTVETMEEVDVVPSNLVSRHVRVFTIFEMID